MKIRRTDAAIVIETPAKLNLFLEVIGRRPDGYHELETVMQTISIFDELTLEPHASEVRLVTDSPEVPADRTNLVVRAAEALREHTGFSRGATITLKKKIPVGAGLGGGSSDAAATLVGLNELWGLRLDREVLHELAARIGSDVAFFLYGGTAICRGRGELVTPLEHVRAMTFVVVYPGIRVSTQEVYKKLDQGDLTKEYQETNIFLEELRKAADTGRLPRFFNRLTDVTVGLHEPLRRLARRMTDSGLTHVTMTGSGSAFFGVARGRKEARASVEILTRAGVGETFVAESIP